MARCIVERDFAGAHALLAPWLRRTLSPSEIERRVDAKSEGLEHAPHAWSVDEGRVDLYDLRQSGDYGPPSDPLADEITGANFRGWLCIQFVPEPAVQDDQNVCYDLWLVAVEHHGRLCVGYLEAWEAT